MDTAGQSPDLTEKRTSKLNIFPSAWYHLCSARQLNDGPMTQVLGGRSFVGFRTQSGRLAVLSGRCSHMGANLGCGEVHGESLVCPLHGWEYGADGVCARIPSMDAISPFARQGSYPVEERGGEVFFFNRKEARFPLPFFDGLKPEELLAARPFDLVADTPWYFVGANGFDIQHFRMAHDRTLMGEPQVIPLPPYGRRVIATFAVTGDSLQDRLTRLVAGPTVTMDVTSWCGTLIVVKALFRRTTSFGIFNVLPVDHQRTLGRVIVWVKRSQNPVGQSVFDPLNAAIRRLFIRTFLRSDLPRIAGLRYHPEKLVAADTILADYFAWLESATEPAPPEPL